jgi:hypothetical protein
MPDRDAMLSASRDQSPAAVSRYQVNKIGKIRGFLANFADFEGRRAAGLFRQFRPAADQYLATTGLAQLKR